MSVLYSTETFTIEACCNCGVHFGMADSLRSRRLSDGKSFYCTNGHSQHFTETDKTRLERTHRLLESAQAQARHADDQREAAERSNRALRGHATRARKRAAAGMCPCCNRTFQNVARHVAGQHPAYVASTKDGR